VSPASDASTPASTNLSRKIEYSAQAASAVNSDSV
jgi:hypothetical protein